MRLFVGVLLPDEVKNEIFEIQKKIGNKNAKINWVYKKNLHLTLKWLGEVEENKLNIIGNCLENVKFKIIKAKIGKLSNFEHLGKIRVLWIGFEPKDEIIDLQKKIDASLLEIFRGDQRFNPHLTLGRVKLIKKLKEFKEDYKNTEINKLEFTISEFCLISSRLTKDGPIYKTMKRFKSQNL